LGVEESEGGNLTGFPTGQTISNAALPGLRGPISTAPLFVDWPCIIDELTRKVRVRRKQAMEGSEQRSSRFMVLRSGGELYRRENALEMLLCQEFFIA
jgi:hypothetical protein